MTVNQSSQALERFITTYSQLEKSNLKKISDLYSNDIIFEDPAHHIDGFDNLYHYFEMLYQNVTECRFDIEKSALNNDQAFVSWIMNVSHPKLANGKLRAIKGCSYLEFSEGFVSYQRDYFDLGQILYEEIPIIGALIKQIKKRFGR